MILQAVLLATLLLPQAPTKTKPPVQAAPKEPAIGTMKRSLKGDIDMMYVPSGEFIMGSKAPAEESPIHKVFLDGYWIGKNCITVAQFRAYCSDSGYEFNWQDNKPDWGWVDNHPMVHVDWDEATGYCKWAGGDLPTEAQWEKAARGTKGILFPWGMEYKPTALQSSIEGTQVGTAPIGTFPDGLSPYGCLDMAGNVYQWCSDWFFGDGYADLPTKNPVGQSFGDYRVMRGGSWSGNEVGIFRAARRSYQDPGKHSQEYGFRLASAKVSP